MAELLQTVNTYAAQTEIIRHRILPSIRQNQSSRLMNFFVIKCLIINIKYLFRHLIGCRIKFTKTYIFQ